MIVSNHFAEFTVVFFSSFSFYRGIGGEIGQDGDFMIFEGSRYRGGFMYKTLAMSAIVSACTKLMMWLKCFFN